MPMPQTDRLLARSRPEVRGAARAPAADGPATCPAQRHPRTLGAPDRRCMPRACSAPRVSSHLRLCGRSLPHSMHALCHTLTHACIPLPRDMSSTGVLARCHTLAVLSSWRQRTRRQRRRQPQLRPQALASPRCGESGATRRERRRSGVGVRARRPLWLPCDSSASLSVSRLQAPALAPWDVGAAAVGKSVTVRARELRRDGFVQHSVFSTLLYVVWSSCGARTLRGQRAGSRRRAPRWQSSLIGPGGACRTSDVSAGRCQGRSRRRRHLQHPCTLRGVWSDVCTAASRKEPVPLATG